MFRTPESKLLALLVVAIWATMAAGDLYIPCMPEMARYYHTNDDWLNLTVSANLLCFPIAGVFYGPLSDAYGRRLIFIIGMGIFLVGCLICALIPNLPIMIAGRFVQGLGACVADIVSLAMIRDLYKGNQSAKMMTTLEVYIVLSPTVAPVLGGIIAQYFGWQKNFMLIFLMALVAFLMLCFKLPETLPVEKRYKLSLQNVWETYKQILCHKIFMGYALVSSFVFAGLFVVIVGLPYLYEDVFHFSVIKFTVYMTTGVIAYVLAAEINRRLVEKYGMRKLMWFGVQYFALTGFLSVGVGYIWPTDPNMIRLVTALYLLFMGFIIANGSAAALEFFSEKTGAATAVLVGIEMIFGVIAISITSYFYEDSFMPLAWIMMFFSTISLLACLVLRRLDPNSIR